MDLFFAEAKEQPNPARVRLGRWLFYDTRLSADNTVSCATCHRPEFAFSEPIAVPTGIGGQKGQRKTPTIVNLAVRPERMAPPDNDPGPTYFWDGRETTLEQQALMPVANPQEMGASHETMIKTLSGIAGYAPYFTQAFGSDGITVERVGAALADYERTRMSGNAPTTAGSTNTTREPCRRKPAAAARSSSTEVAVVSVTQAATFPTVSSTTWASDGTSRRRRLPMTGVRW